MSKAGSQTPAHPNGLIYPGQVISCTNGSVGKMQQNDRKDAKSWDHILSTESFSREPSIMQALHATLSEPGILSLGPGAPSSQYYPFDGVEFNVPSIGHFTEVDMENSSLGMLARKYDLKEGKSKYDLSQALNYGQGTGSPQLLAFVTEHTKLVHDPKYLNWKCILSGGNTSALDLSFRMLSERGSCVLVEEFVYPTAFEAASPLGVHFMGVKLDQEGIIAEKLDELLENWDEARRGSKKPHLLYTVPTGQNPTGATPSLQRRMAIYQVAQKHDLYILEDDPYYFIQMLPDSELHDATAPSPEDFIASLVPSYLSLDTDGRVLRMDSFSKIIVPGARTGWITASEQIIQRLVRAHETSLQNPSGFSQIMLYKLLHEAWGHNGLFNWLFYLQTEYTKRRNNLISACEQHLPRKIVRVTPPKAGFFAWINIDTSSHPHTSTKSPQVIEKEIYDATVKEGALVVPGNWFRADQKAQPQKVFFRLTFASLDLKDTTEAIRRLGVAIRTCFEIDPHFF